jgi:hypothetical protein
MFQLLSGGEALYSGILPPTFDYSIGDTIKECVHYGFEAMFFIFVEMNGIIWFISLDSFYAYPEYIARCQYKGFRLFAAAITSVFYVSGRGTNGNWTYRFSTTLLNDKVGNIDLSSSSVSLILYKIKLDGTFDSIETGTFNVQSINGMDIIVTGPPPANTAKDYPDGWVGGFFVFNKYILINNPLLLYTDRSSSDTPNIPNNKYVVETPLGYETRAQQMEKTGGVNGVYASKQAIIALLDQKIADPASTAVVVTQSTDDKTAINANTYPVLDPEGMIYGDLTTAFGKRLLGYLKDLKSTSITLYVGIGGGTTRNHNMHAGCLSGDYVSHAGTTISDTYKISNQLRRSIFQFDVVSKTSVENLLDQLIALADPTTYSMTVKISRCWFFNDITFSTDKMSLNKAMFWGHVTSAGVPVPATIPATSKITLMIDDGFWIYNERQNLINRFTQTISPSLSGTVLIKAWDEQKGWKLNKYGGQTYSIMSMIPSPSDVKSYDITISEDLTGVTLNSTDKWWISFDEKIATTGNYNYISQPTFEMQAALSSSSESLRFGSLVLDGIYVSNPFRIPIPGDAVVSVVMETGGIYPNTVVPPPVYISTARKGSPVGFSRNKQRDSRMLLYQHTNDPSLYLMVRTGGINFGYEVNEKFVYYGDALVAAAPVSGAVGSDLTIDMSSHAKDSNIIAFSCKRSSAAPASTSTGTYDFVAWGVYHGSYFLGYPSSSGKVSTIYTRRDGTYKEEETSMFNYYLPGNIMSSGIIKYDIAVNTQYPNSNVIDATKLYLKPKYNNSSSPSISDVNVYYVPYENMLKDCSSPYVYEYKNIDVLLYTKNQVWMGAGNSVSLTTCSVVRQGSVPAPTLTLSSPASGASPAAILNTDDIKALVDPKQDGVFVMSTSDNFLSYNSAMYMRPSNWIAPGQTNATDPGQKFTDITSITESNLYKIPHLLAPNITRAYCNEESRMINIVGFSNVKSSATSSNDVLSLVFYRINLLDTLVYPVYSLLDSSNKPLFTYCDCQKNYRRLLIQKTAYAKYTEENPAIAIPEDSLSLVPVCVGGDDKSLIVIVHLSGGFVYLISTNGGKDWSYFDDVKLVFTPSASVSSPSCKILDNQLYLFYLLNNTDLYLKIIPMAKLLNLDPRCRGVKSSSVQDSSFVTSKNTLQAFLNDSCYVNFVKQINDQQIACNFANTKDFHVIYQDIEGKVNAVATTNLGKSWNYRPVNF